MDAERAVDNGGGSGSRVYNRDPRGTTTGGQFTSGSATQSTSSTSGRIYAPRPTKGSGGSTSDPKAGLPASSRFKTLAPGGDNDPQAVKDMQQLLSALGFGNLNASGEYDQATQDAVKAVQARLGVKKPNGHADRSLVNKLLTAYDLSPCIQR